jgi:hypothetical protein
MGRPAPRPAGKRPAIAGVTAGVAGIVPTMARSAEAGAKVRGRGMHEPETPGQGPGAGMNGTKAN